MIRLLSVFAFFLYASLWSSAHGDGDDAPPVRALVTHGEHLAFLKDAVAAAKRTLMISSYTVDPDQLVREEIGLALDEALKRGVKVYIYYEHRPYYDAAAYSVLEDLQKRCKRFEMIPNHSKCIIQDNVRAASGSYNWLSRHCDTATECSFVVTGEAAKTLKEDIWQCVRFYQSRKHKNARGESAFLNDATAFAPALHAPDTAPLLQTIRTPEAHHKTLEMVFATAQSHITLVSPFVRLASLKATLHATCLETLAARGVFFKLVCLPDPCSHTKGETKPLFAYLKSLRKDFPNFAHETRPHLHAKLLMVDDTFLCAGSYNWLSAAKDLSADFHNFEMSIALTGHRAGTMAASMGQTSLKTLLAPLPDQSFHHLFGVYSGERFGKQGYCVRLVGATYLKDANGRTLYFSGEDEAVAAGRAAYLAHKTPPTCTASGAAS